MKSGTESLWCPASGILCDLNHVNVGGAQIIDVIRVTNMTCKKNTVVKVADSALKCEVCHIMLALVCL